MTDQTAVDYRTTPPSIEPTATTWQAWWEDHDMWDGDMLYADLATAKHHSAVAYVGEEYAWLPGDDPDDEAPDRTLAWELKYGRWRLLDNGGDTGVRLAQTRTYAAPAVPAGQVPATDRDAMDRVRAVLETEAVVGRSALEYRGLIATALMADDSALAVVSAVPGQADNEDPARIDRLRPEFTEHSSIEAIDAQLQRAQSQERRWHLRTEWLISLRATRMAQQARGEWPAAGAQQDETCTNCRGSGLDPRYNGEFACPDCPAAAEAQQPKEA
ncbi:hypothetical protein [Streptomyces chartreusis]|uniref:hypothetical protein n=1 Tax=Streptomyces chartreusis TaxID=1969 RepID=UPI003828FE6C